MLKFIKFIGYYIIIKDIFVTLFVTLVRFGINCCYFCKNLITLSLKRLTFIYNGKFSIIFVFAAKLFNNS